MRSRLPPVLAVVVLVVAGCAIETRTPGVSSSPIPAAPTSSLQPSGRTEEGDVVKVVDGDTIDVEINGERYRVRYIGIDAPETVKPSTPVEWMGPEASAANWRLVAGKHVVLEKDVSETDRYDRLLRYVWLHDGGTWTMVNLRLVELGYAAAVSYPPDVHWQHLLLDAQTRARKAGAGLWGPGPGGSG